VRLGFHVSIAGGFAQVKDRALAVGCESIQLFSSNPRGWQVARLDDDDVARFRADMALAGITPVFCHVPYLPNLAAGPGAARKRSVQAIVTQMDRCARLGIDYLVCHVGRALGTAEEKALARVAANVDAVLAKARNRVMLLIENTAGMGSEVGYRFDQIAGIIGRIGERSRVGVMLDTAHSFEAGYDWRTKAAVDANLREFDRTIGIARLHGLHLNDSKTEFGSRVDRHWHIGQGRIGKAGFRLLVNHPLLRKLPGIMETPRASAKDDIRNMMVIRSLVA
jgi:deoxyribonuclease IV